MTTHVTGVQPELEDRQKFDGEEGNVIESWIPGVGPVKEEIGDRADTDAWIYRPDKDGFVPRSAVDDKQFVKHKLTDFLAHAEKADGNELSQCLEDLQESLQKAYETEALMIKDIFTYKSSRTDGAITIYELDSLFHSMGIRNWDSATFYEAVRADENEILTIQDLKVLANFPSDRKNYMKKKIGGAVNAMFAARSLSKVGLQMRYEDKLVPMDAPRAETRPRGRFHFQPDDSSRIYFQTCVINGVAPRHEEFLVSANVPHVSLPGSDFEPMHVQAVVDSLSHRGVPLQSLDLKQCSMEVPATIKLFELFKTNRKIMCSDLTHLDLGSPCIRMNPSSAQLIGDLLANCLKGLRYFSLAEMPLPEYCWSDLAVGLQSCHSLRVINLADTNLGRRRQRSCIEVCEALARNYVQDLDVSGNFFMADGLVAMNEFLSAASCSLLRLNLSRNVVGLEDMPPIMSFCEELARATSLEHIAMAECDLSYEEDIILETVLLHNQCPIKSLDLRGNPHGDGGLRSIFRMMLRAESEVQFIDFSEFRDAVQHKHAALFHYPDPSGRYRLKLSHPQHRAVLVLLARRLLDAGRTIEESFMEVKLDGRLIQRSDVEKILFTDSQCFDPAIEQGWVNFKFVFKLETQEHFSSDKDHSQIDIALSNFFRQTKMVATLTRFAILIQGIKAVQQPERILLVSQAIAKDICLKPCQVKLLLKMCKKKFPKSVVVLEQVAQALLPAIPMIEQDSIRDMFDESSSMVRFLKQVGNLVFFNPRCPTNRYKLDMAKPSERSAMERLMIVDSWEKAKSAEMNLPDVGQYGHHHCLRNVILYPPDNPEVPISIHYHGTWMLPFEGTITCDYVSPFRMAPGIKTDQKMVDKLCKALKTPNICLGMKLRALRDIAHDIVVNPSQCLEICSLFAEKQDCEHYGDDTPESCSSSINSEVLEDLTTRKDDFRWNVECFVMLFNRTTDYLDLVCYHGLYNSVFFNEHDIDQIQERLGHANTFDAFTLGEIYKTNPTQIPPTHMMNIGSDEMKDEFGNDLVTCNLKKWDEWIVCKYITHLARFEPKENVLAVMHSDGMGGVAPDSFADGPLTRPPAPDASKTDKISPDWFPDPPHSGLFTCIYQNEHQRETSRNHKDRIRLGVKLFGWKVFNLFFLNEMAN